MTTATPPKNKFVFHAVLVGISTGLFLLFIGIALMASVPPVSRDALTHHLAIPKLYLAHGGLVELPEIPFSYYPMNLDLLYWAALAFSNDIIPKYVHLLFGLLTGGVIYLYLKERMGRVLGMFGVLTWLSTPIVVRLASEVYVDLGVAFFGAASVYMLIRWVENNFRARYLVYSGIWCGLALGTKYNALVMLAILSLMVPFIRSRMTSRLPQTVAQELQRAEKPPVTKEVGGTIKSVTLSTICFVIVALAVFSPWMVRNLVLKQNPVYPMLAGLFAESETGTSQWSRTSTMVHDTGGTMAVRHLVFKESLGYMALMPIRIFFEGRDDSPRHFDGKLNPFLLLFSVAGFIPLGSLAAQRRIEQRIWFWFALLFVLMAFFTAPIRIRYILPALPAIVVLAMIGIDRICRFVGQMKPSLLKRFLQAALIGAVLAMMGYNSIYFLERFQRVDPLPYIKGDISRDRYIAERVPEYSLIRAIHKELPPEAVILGLFLGQRRYYFDNEVILSENLFKNCLQGNSDKKSTVTKLRQHNITHLMIRRDLFINWIQNSLNDKENAALNHFWNNNIRKIAEANGYLLYELIEG